MWFSNTPYRIKLLIGDMLEVKEIIGTEFLNRHVTEIICTRQRIQFGNGELPIIKQVDARVDGEVTLIYVRKLKDGPPRTGKDHGKSKVI